MTVFPALGILHVEFADFFTKSVFNFILSLIMSTPLGTEPAPNKAQNKVQNMVDLLDRPVTAAEKAGHVRQMFDDIAPRYDLLNTLMSAGIHHGWRVFATRCAGLEAGSSALDICSGTGEWTDHLRRVVGPSGLVAAADFSLPMLAHGQERFARNRVGDVQGDATRLPFADSSFDAVTIAFGIRNIPERETAFREMRRVLRPGGRVVCLECSQPASGPFRSLYDLHTRYVMPTLGGAISGRRDAYAYLPASVARFDSRPQLAGRMRDSGLTQVRWVDLTFGLVCVHVGVKPLDEN